MQLLKPELNINYLGMRRAAAVFSMLFIIASIASLALRGLNFGIDFTGGYQIRAAYEQAPDLAKIREGLRAKGFESFIVQYYGTSTEVMIRLAPDENIQANVNAEGGEPEINLLMLDILKSIDEDVEVLDIAFVGPQVGEELKEDGGLAILFSLLCILAYIAFRFEKRFALGAVLALIHDVIITLGVFSFLQISFDLTVLAAVLAVIGYSLNDTIVVFDRIRENFRKMRKGTPLEISNISLNQTMARTIMTGVTTLLVLFALFFLGGEVIYGFSLALIVGIIVGTYSSIFIATASVLALGLSREDLLVVKKEGEVDSVP